MAQAESDLGTKLDWVAVDHFNTDQPHTHVMVRGVDETGGDLIIARDYIADGFRERAVELVTADLGPRTDQEIEAQLHNDVEQERFARIDQRLLLEVDSEHELSILSDAGVPQSIMLGRLHKLRAMGLASEIDDSRWTVSDGLEDALRKIEERGDAIKTIERELSLRGMKRPGVDHVVVTELHEPLAGRIIHCGVSKTHPDRSYVMLDGLDGRVHYLDVGVGTDVSPIPEGSIVRMTPRTIGSGEIVRAIVEVARCNAGCYSPDAHMRHDPAVTQGIAESHVRRLELLHQDDAGFRRNPDGSWIIEADHLDRVASVEATRLRNDPISIETLSSETLAAQEHAEAPTWLDRQLSAANPPILRDVGFGREVRLALASRRQWLIEQQLAEGEGRNFRLRSGAILMLQRRELLAAANRLSRELGKPVLELEPEGSINGRLIRRVDLSSGGQFALVEHSRDFRLVPWQPELDQEIGRDIQGSMQSGGIAWRSSRDRFGPEIS